MESLICRISSRVGSNIMRIWNKEIYTVVVPWLDSHGATRPCYCWGFTISSHSDTLYALGRPLDEGSAHSRDHYLHNTQQIQETNIYTVSGIRACNSCQRKTLDPRLRRRHPPVGQVYLLRQNKLINFRFTCKVWSNANANNLNGIRPTFKIECGDSAS